MPGPESAPAAPTTGQPTPAAGVAPAPAAAAIDDAAARRAATKAAVLAGAARPAVVAAVPIPVAAAVTAVPIPAADPAAPSAGDPPELAAARRAEQHTRRQLAQERAQQQAEFDAQKLAWQPRLDKADAIDRAVANAAKDPIAAIRALGFADEQFDMLGRLIYGHSPEGKKDPRYKASAEAMSRDRDRESKLETLEKKITSFEAEKQTQAEQQRVQQQLDAYADTLTAAAGDATPLVRAGMTSAAAATREKLLAIADELYVQSGPAPDLREVPAAAAVLSEYERRRTRELEAMRPEYEALGARAAPVPVATPAVVAAGAAVAAAAELPLPVKKSRAELIAGIQGIRATTGS